MRETGIRPSDTDKVKARLDIQIWWGWEDMMVPRKGQLWFNKTLSRFPGELAVTVHDVPTGDHSDL